MSKNGICTLKLIPFPYIIYAGYKNMYAVPDDVLITGIQYHISPNKRRVNKMAKLIPFADN